MFSLMPWRKERNEVEARGKYAHPLSLFRGEFDALFDRFLGNWPEMWRDWPKAAGVQMEETDKEIVYKFDAPGFDAKDFDISVTADMLKLVAEKKEEKTETKEGYQRRLQHHFTLPATVDPEKVEAVYRNGVLELRLARTAEAHGKKIEVKS